MTIKSEMKILYTTKGLYIIENGINSYYAFEKKSKKKMANKNHIYNHKLFVEWILSKKLSIFMKSITIFTYPDTSLLETEFLEQLFKEQLVKKISFKPLFARTPNSLLIFSTSDCFYLIYPINNKKSYQVKDTFKDVVNSLKLSSNYKILVCGDKKDLDLIAKKIEKKTTILTLYQEDLFQLMKSA